MLQRASLLRAVTCKALDDKMMHVNGLREAFAFAGYMRPMDSIKD